MAGLFEQLHHRSIFRVTAGYAVVAWVLIEVASIILPTFGAPAWVFQVFVAFVIMGLPIALVLAWAFGDTPDGAEPDALRLTQNNMIVDGVLVALLAVLVGLSGFSYFAKPRVVEVAASTRIDTEISIAVLAFRDLSQGQNHIHLAEGISEEILNALAQVPDLRVASRTTSFSFRDDLMPTAEMNEVLNVAYILEGSVRISGSNMRITAQLIDTATDAHLWSNSFDRPMEDIFAVQDEVSNLILTALNTEMGTAFAELNSDQGTDSVEAYSADLLGRHHMAQREAEAMRLAVSAYEQAIAIDPLFADAYAGLGRAYYLNYDAWDAAEVAQSMRDNLYEAINLDPDNAVALATLSLIMRENPEQVVEAGILARLALQLAPNDIEIKMSLSNAYHAAGRYRDAFFLLQEILEENPDFPPALINLTDIYGKLGRFDIVLQNMLRVPMPEDDVQAIGQRLYIAMLAYRTGDMSLYERMYRAALEGAEGNETMSRGLAIWTAQMDLLEGNPAPLQQVIEDGTIEWFMEQFEFFDANDAAIVYGLAGHTERSIGYFEQAFDEGIYDIFDDRFGPFQIPEGLFENPDFLELLERPNMRSIYRLQEAARSQGQWEPLTPEELGELTN